MNKNVTLSMDEKLLEKARILTAKQGTSLNRFLRNAVEEFVSKNDESEKRRLAALAKLQAMSRKSKTRLGKDYKFDRESLYAD